jgi:hypothetical protein
MDACLGEFDFRSNHRQMRNAMFDLLIAANWPPSLRGIKCGPIDQAYTARFLLGDKLL